MDYSKSICFSVAPAEELNRKAFRLNRSLFMFAYYEPKPLCEKESFRSKFTTAIINLYGLFWDCGPFVFDLLFTQDSILLHDWSKTQIAAKSIKGCISAFRSIFCHNNSILFPLNEEKNTNAIKWAAKYHFGGQDLNEIPEDGWKTLLEHLITMADSLVTDMNNSLDALLITENKERKERAVERWIQKIAEKYQKNPTYLLNTMAGLYQLYLVNSYSERDWNQSLRSLTIKWICSKRNLQQKDWFSKWLDVTEPEGLDSSIISNTRIYYILKDWPNKWAEWNGLSSDECDEAPMPASQFFRILACDVDRFAQNPGLFEALSDMKS